MFEVEFVDLDCSRLQQYEDWYPHVEGGGRVKFESLKDAIEFVTEIWDTEEYSDARIISGDAPEEYTYFANGTKRYPC